MIEAAIDLNRRILQISMHEPVSTSSHGLTGPSPGTYISLGIMIAPFDRTSQEGLSALKTGNTMHVSLLVFNDSNCEYRFTSLFI